MEGKEFEDAVRQALRNERYVWPRDHLRKISSYAYCGPKRKPDDYRYRGGRVLIASDIPLSLTYTRRMIFLEDGEMAVLSEHGLRILTMKGKTVQREPKIISWDPVMRRRKGISILCSRNMRTAPGDC